MDKELLSQVEKIAESILKNPKNIENFKQDEIWELITKINQSEKAKNLDKKIQNNINGTINMSKSVIWAGLGTLLSLYNYPEMVKFPSFYTLISLFITALKCELGDKLAVMPTFKVQMAAVQKILKTKEVKQHLYTEKKEFNLNKQEKDL